MKCLSSLNKEENNYSQKSKEIDSINYEDENLYNDACKEEDKSENRDLDKNKKILLW